MMRCTVLLTILASMTISYAAEISDGQGLYCIYTLFMRWKGSLYKLLWVDLLIYVGLYYFINIMYRFVLEESHKRIFEEIVKFCDSKKNNIPLSFLLGFFVAGIIGRWWKMYFSIPWLNKIAFICQSIIIGNGPIRSRGVRLIILRYMNLAWILLMRNISAQIKVRFEQNKRMKDKSGTESYIKEILENINSDEKICQTFKKIITPSEIRAFETIASKYNKHHKVRYEPEYWVPIQWASRIIHKCFIHGFISDPRTMTSLNEEVEELREQMQKLQIYSNILIPLVYTQVVVIAVYSYFLVHLLAAQFIDPRQRIVGHEVDFYVPVFTIFQFLFMMGWLKVAMCVMNPFGDDDEDFQTSEMLDFNLDVSFRSSEAGEDMYPALLKPAIMKYRQQDSYEEDNLQDFIDEVEQSLQQCAEPPVRKRKVSMAASAKLFTSLHHLFKKRSYPYADRDIPCYIHPNQRNSKFSTFEDAESILLENKENYLLR